MTRIVLTGRAGPDGGVELHYLAPLDGFAHPDASDADKESALVRWHTHGQRSLVMEFADLPGGMAFDARKWRLDYSFEPPRLVEFIAPVNDPKQFPSTAP